MKINEKLEQFRIAFHLFRVDVQDDRLVYKTTQPKYSASAARELIKTLGLDLVVEIPFESLYTCDRIVILDPVEADSKLIKAQMTLEHHISNQEAA